MFIMRLELCAWFVKVAGWGLLLLAWRAHLLSKGCSWGLQREGMSSANLLCLPRRKLPAYIRYFRPSDCDWFAELIYTGLALLFEAIGASWRTYTYLSQVCAMWFVYVPFACQEACCFKRELLESTPQITWMIITQRRYTNLLRSLYEEQDLRRSWPQATWWLH